MANFYRFRIVRNEYLKNSLDGYFSIDFESFGKTGILSFLHILKNTRLDELPVKLQEAKNEAIYHIMTFLTNYVKDINEPIIVCRIPRSKSYFTEKSLYFQKAVEEAVELANSSLNDKLIDGIDYITRIEDVATTHLATSDKAKAAFPQLCSGEMPYPGITKDTCEIKKDKIENRTVLLIDDIYTLDINIVEDCIQALYDKGAKCVIFYAVGRTVKRDNTPAIEH